MVYFSTTCGLSSTLRAAAVEAEKQPAAMPKPTPRPAAMDKRMRFSRLAVGWGFIAAAHQDRTYVSMHGTVSGDKYYYGNMEGGHFTLKIKCFFQHT